MKALVVIDMLNDFVTGKIANPRAERIIPNVQELLARARADRREWLVVYANDAHMPNDFELKVWGEHAMAGTPGAEIIPELAAEPGDFVLPKRTYSSFHETAWGSETRLPLRAATSVRSATMPRRASVGPLPVLAASPRLVPVRGAGNG